MNPAATKPAKGKPTRSDYVSRFADAVTRLSSKEGDNNLLAQIPQTLVEEFEAARCELWLWDESSRSAYLTHVAGQEAGRRRDFAQSDVGSPVIVAFRDGSQHLRLHGGVFRRNPAGSHLHSERYRKRDRRAFLRRENQAVPVCSPRSRSTGPLRASSPELSRRAQSSAPTKRSSRAG